MYSPEQEAQLTRWGCPGEHTWDTDPATGYTTGHITEVPRQPHDVLAWLNDGFDAANNALDVAILVASSRGSRASKITAYNGTIELQPGWCFPAADPYAATFALAQAIMEAKCVST